MKILKGTVTIDELSVIAEHGFGDIVKAVVDVEKDIIAIDAELHSDLEALCIDNGSDQRNLWGINYYPSMEDGEFIEFDSMINLKPSQGNKSRGVDDKAVRDKIVSISNKWIKRSS